MPDLGSAGYLKHPNKQLMKEMLQFETEKPSGPGNYANLTLLKAELSNVYTDRNHAGS